MKEVDQFTMENEIKQKVKSYYENFHLKSEFKPGESKIQYAGRVYDYEEIWTLVKSALDFWLTVGPETEKFENELASFFGINYFLFVNSGSSANLIALSTLRSNQIPNRLSAGDEVITPIVTFPTTVNPIIQNGLIPVFVDVKLGSYNIDTDRLQDALSNETKALMIPHILGNPNNMGTLVDFAKKHSLYLIEDVCEAMGSKYQGKFLGSFGELSTFSFYAAHHITTGEGGAVASNDYELISIANSLRDWGRAQKYRKPPQSDLDRYRYDEIGYNLKATDLQAAIGYTQLRKFKHFMELRKQNFDRLFDALMKYDHLFVLPEWEKEAEPCWFAFPLTIKDNTKFNRRDLTNYLNNNNIEIRPLLSGNILDQPAYKNVRYRKVGEFYNAEKISKNSFFIGLYPGISRQEIEYIISKFEEFIKTNE